MRRRARQWAGLCAGVLTAGLAAGAALAGDCPGNPAALGTSRTLVVDPREHPRIGAMQYGETLPLQDHEVVLTFDDGPLPRYSNQILDILASECVKATFFTVGRMAQDHPEGVRKLRDAGHTIGTHTENHPLFMKRLPIEHARQEIDDGIAAVQAAAGDPGAVAPFFRIPGLSRAESAEDYVASLGIQTWSADFLADDWRNISSARVFELAMKRLEARGKGILLLHDIHERTVAALPRILHELKARGYRIVHVVAATPDRPKTQTEAREWQVHPGAETVPVAHWPQVPSFSFAYTDVLPVQGVSEAELRDQLVGLPESFYRTQPLADRSQGLAHGSGALPQQGPWPRQATVSAAESTSTLPVPGEGIFQIPEINGAAIKTIAARSHRAERSPVSAPGRPDRRAKLVSPDAPAPKPAVRVASATPNHAPGRSHSVTIFATHSSMIKVRNSRSI